MEVPLDWAAEEARLAANISIAAAVLPPFGMVTRLRWGELGA